MPPQPMHSLSDGNAKFHHKERVEQGDVMTRQRERGETEHKEFPYPLADQGAGQDEGDVDGVLAHQ